MEWCHHVTKGGKLWKDSHWQTTCCDPEVRSAHSMQSLAKTSHMAHPTSKRLGNTMLACDRREMNQKYLGGECEWLSPEPCKRRLFQGPVSGLRPSVFTPMAKGFQPLGVLVNRGKVILAHVGGGFFFKGSLDPICPLSGEAQ